ncbi:DNA helicase [Colletotrichum sojae]|uniref:DNA helicase n=1 Tax=Colletotrichum sojae TaxID=2175907 RepID=A0A8H6ITK1_9PEZI|nr:DNA helicase [Colletotrichum sojae]
MTLKLSITCGETLTAALSLPPLHLLATGAINEEQFKALGQIRPQTLTIVLERLVEAADLFWTTPAACANEDAFATYATIGVISALRFLQGSGIPVYRMHTQLRMANGLFDLVRKVIYPDVPLKYHPVHCDIDQAKFTIGRNLEDFIRARYPDVQPPPEGRLSPFFLNCDGTRVWVNPVTKSKRSADQVNAALNFAQDFVTAKGVNPASLVMISPYADNVELIDRWRKRPEWQVLSGMPPAATIDSYQGQEADIVIVVMGTRAFNPGPGFTKGPQRLYKGLWDGGRVATTAVNQKAKEQAEMDDGQDE